MVKNSSLQTPIVYQLAFSQNLKNSFVQYPSSHNVSVVLQFSFPQVALSKKKKFKYKKSQCDQFSFPEATAQSY